MKLPYTKLPHGFKRPIVRIAVAHNGDVIPRDRYDGVCLNDGDSVEVVRMVGGG